MQLVLRCSQKGECTVVGYISIIEDAFKCCPIANRRNRYYFYIYALIAKWARDAYFNSQASYYDALRSPAAAPFLSAAMLTLPKEHAFINFVNCYTESLCICPADEFISTFAPYLFAGDPKTVFDYLLSTQPDNTLHSNILSVLKLQAVIITRLNFLRDSYPALPKRLSSIEDYKSILFRSFLDSDTYSRTSRLFTFDKDSFFKLWLLVNGVEFAPQPVSVKRNTAAPLKKLLGGKTDIEHILQLFFPAFSL